MVPHLATALTGPLGELEQRVIDAMPAIERWFRLEWMEHTPPFYCSVDVRNSGFKIAPVDTNLFPGGWNHLSDTTLPLAVQAAMAAIEKICPEARDLLIVPENHDRSPGYVQNLLQLQRIFAMAGLNVRFGSISPDVVQAQAIGVDGTVDVGSADVAGVLLEPATRSHGRMGLRHFVPCTILLNNDLSSGVPGILEDLHTQYVLPPLHAAWSTRRKSRHFRSYEEVCKRFAKLLGMDRWLIYPESVPVEAVDFSVPAHVQRLAAQVDGLLTKVRRKYKEYGIKERPFVMVKADNGTDGLGIMTVRDAQELLTLSSADLRSMAQGKGAGHLGERDLILQEGVGTIERVRNAPAEPVVYMMDRYVVGGFYRTHAKRGADESLNAPGAGFTPLAFVPGTQQPHSRNADAATAPNRFYLYGVVARLALLAASYELEATDPQAETYG